MPPLERQVCYLHVTFKDSPHGNLIKVAFKTNKGLVNTMDNLTAQYAQKGQEAQIEVLSEEDGDKMVKSAVLTYPLWSDLVASGDLTPLVFEN